MEQENYIIEFYALGKFVKVTAIDPVTLTEASIVGDPNASKHELSKLAVRKLKWKISGQRLVNSD